MSDADLIRGQYEQALRQLRTGGKDIATAEWDWALFNGETNIAVSCGGVAIPVKFESRFRAHSDGSLPIASAVEPDPTLFATALATVQAEPAP